MHESYRDTVGKISAWAAAEAEISGIVIIGSQAREREPGDRWSDLDVIVFTESPDKLKRDRGWPAKFGRPACIATETVFLSWLSFEWFVLRPLYDDGRAVDFSILPRDRLEDALAVNREIHRRGYEVIHDDAAGTLAAQIGASLRVEAPLPPPPDAAAFGELVHDLLYHVVWSYRKLRRGELWAAVSCINGYMKDRLLGLVEASIAAAGSGNAPLYEGRFLEKRAPAPLLARLRGCVAKYDAADAAAVLDRLPGVIRATAGEAAENLGFTLDEAAFARVEAVYDRLKGEP